MLNLARDFFISLAIVCGEATFCTDTYPNAMSDTANTSKTKPEAAAPSAPGGQGTELPSTYQPKMKVGFNHGPRTLASGFDPDAVAAEKAAEKKKNKTSKSDSSKRIKHGDELLSSKHAEDQAHFRFTQLQQHQAHYNVLSGGEVVIPQKRWYRQRAHANPFSDHNLV